MGPDGRQALPGMTRARDRLAEEQGHDRQRKTKGRLAVEIESNLPKQIAAMRRRVGG